MTRLRWFVAGAAAALLALGWYRTDAANRALIARLDYLQEIDVNLRQLERR